MRTKIVLAAVALVGAGASLAGVAAQEPKKIALPRADQEPLAVAAPVFGQLVAYTLPKGFRTVAENTRGNVYAREAVLRGQSTGAWTQMISVTGQKGAVAEKGMTPQKFAERVANAFKQGCTAGFLAKPLAAAKIDGQETFATVVTCASAKSASGDHSETTVIVAIKGKADYFTVQWAERGAAAKKAEPIDEAKWTERVKLVGPVRLCPVVEGEVAPYPSCLRS